jgi:2'-5' RNA ligase
VARFLEENGALRVEPFMATRFVLLSARPGTGGGPYVVEAEFPFEGVGPFEGTDEHAEDRLGD